ncbi:MAG: glycosyltransferase family 4 protein, partial [Okeania sp. SIO2D1]|nr:glycosyltransferase family 4 protein [Okeania sp. SIO2D1]
LVEAVEKFENSQEYFQPEIIRKHAYKFSPEVFQNSYLSFLEKCYTEFKSTGI